jgi:23S rRNA (adenine2030-N6)-methyltransferase
MAAAALSHALEGDRRAKAIAIDGWTALNAYIPPPERRGLALIDPPYEAAADFARLAGGLANAHRKWATGTFLLWYPIKQRQGPDALARRLGRAGIDKILRIEFAVAASAEGSALTACGLLVVNPPWTLEDELSILLPALASVLAQSSDAGVRLDWLAREN